MCPKGHCDVATNTPLSLPGVLFFGFFFSAHRVVFSKNPFDNSSSSDRRYTSINASWASLVLTTRPSSSTNGVPFSCLLSTPSNQTATGLSLIACHIATHMSHSYNQTGLACGNWKSFDQAWSLWYMSSIGRDNIFKKGTSEQHTATDLVNSFIYPTGFVWLLHTSSGIKQDSTRNLFYTLTIQYKECSM